MRTGLDARTPNDEGYADSALAYVILVTALGECFVKPSLGDRVLEISL